jgi:hypothetical protein
MNRIYQITIVEDVENINSDDNDFSHPFFEEVALSLNEKDTNYIGFSDNDEMFVRLDTIKLKRVVDIMKKYFVIEVKDVSDKVISGELQRLYPEVETLTPKLFRRFRLDNETVDDVLDKINENGLKSLDKVDKKILKKSRINETFLFIC